jgi:predicted nucleic acid-binding protein
MGEIVVDNSVVVAWCFADQATELSLAVLAYLENHTAVAPGVFPLELGNALVVAERRKKLARADAQRFLRLVQSLPLRVEQELPQRQLGEVLALARQYDLSTYDAAYLDLAMRAALPLATMDQPLRVAAKRAGVPLFQ